VKTIGSSENNPYRININTGLNSSPRDRDLLLATKYYEFIPMIFIFITKRQIKIKQVEERKG